MRRVGRRSAVRMAGGWRGEQAAGVTRGCGERLHGLSDKKKLMNGFDTFASILKAVGG